MEDLLLTLVPVVLTILIGYLGIATKMKSVSKEIGELFIAIMTALEDGKISREEVEQIIKEAKDIPEALKQLKK